MFNPSPTNPFATAEQSYFNMAFAGKIRDPLHDTIPYTACEKVIIDRPEFQRLRRIHQTAFIQYVFPGATHTRFEHSIGTMHIAGLLYAALIANQRRILNSLEQAFVSASPESKKAFLRHEEQAGSLLQTRLGLESLSNSAYLFQCLRFAALLHDCGHSALSHSGERFMPSWQETAKQLSSLSIPDWLKKALKTKIEKKKNTQSSISHEVYTLLIIHKLFQYEEEFLSPKMGQDICAILDLSIPPNPDSQLDQSKMQALFHEVVSGEIDVDRMDYLLRDSKECGVVYGHFDLGRILDSLSFYFDPSEQHYHLALRRSGISAYEDYLRARMSMYNQVYFHKTATACEAMLEFLRKHLVNFSFPLDIESYIKIDDYNVIKFFKDHLPNNTWHEFTETLIENLLLHRKLWKRVFEEAILFHKSENYNSKCSFIMDYLAEKDIPSTLIETTTNLTRFSPRWKGANVHNKFKVIIKDVDSLRTLEPITTQSNLINRIDEEFLLKRIFISRYNASGEQIDIASVQKNISERIHL